MNEIYSVQARINPVFFTAKTAVCLMTQAGIADSDKIARCLHLENNQPLKYMPDAETILGNALVVEAKYRTMCHVIENSGYRTCVDLPCGYTPKALHVTEKGLRFIGMDLPIVVQEFSPVIHSLAKYPDRISFCEVDATNYESLQKALRGIDEPLCITTEGMMMYFTESEVDAVISNIRALLERHGGCWITPDPEIKLQFMLTFKSVFGEDSLGKLTTTGNAAMKQSDVANLFNSFILDLENVPASLKAAENLLASHGLKFERINLSANMPELGVYRQLTPAQIHRFKDAMRHCHYWVISLDDTRKLQETATPKQNSFEMSHTYDDGILLMTLRGRVDSLSAPKILASFENEKARNVIDEVKINCAALEYISSAGIRMLIDINENCNGGLMLFNVNAAVGKILAQKGFTEVEVNKWKVTDKF
ncbi:MAG: STAS domain-containing protein [Selenomonadaceae bacterium]|nr:STAS domain-containing protein [Selenomonadaceae bacterium]